MSSGQFTWSLNITEECQKGSQKFRHSAKPCNQRGNTRNPRAISTERQRSTIYDIRQWYWRSSKECSFLLQNLTSNVQQNQNTGMQMVPSKSSLSFSSSYTPTMDNNGEAFLPVFLDCCRIRRKQHTQGFSERYSVKLMNQSPRTFQLILKEV